MEDLKKKYTVVVVTHNMQQAARVSDYTAFFLLGELIEFDTTDTIFKHRPRRRQRITLPVDSVDGEQKRRRKCHQEDYMKKN